MTEGVPTALPHTAPAPDARLVVPPPRPDGWRPRLVATDLDGTLLGRGASLLHDGDGAFTLLGVRALEACHRAGVEVVIKSGRRESSVIEDAKLMGCDSYICEVGCLVIMDGERTVLVGDLEPHPGKSLAETWVDQGIPDELFEHFDGRLEWHSPWHRQLDLSLLFRGKIDVEEGNRLLAERGHEGVRLLDNGAIFAPMEGIDGPAHAYHLLPEGASKAKAVAFHMQARGYSPEECIAIGDSVEDLAVADVVGRFFVPANGPERDPALAEAIGGKGKVYVSNVKPGISTTDQREEGFKAEIANHKDIEVLETQFNDDDANKAAAQFQAVLGRVPDLAGVFGANLFSASGTANGVKQAGVTGKVKLANAMKPESIVAQLKDGTFELTIAQHPAEIGYFGFMAAYAHVTGNPVPTAIGTGFSVMTKANIDDPNVNKYLYKSA